MVTLTSDPALSALFLYKSWAGRRTHETKCCDYFPDVTSPAAVIYQMLCFIKRHGGVGTHSQAARALSPRRACALFTEPALQAEAGGGRVRQACGCHTPEDTAPGRRSEESHLGREQEMARHWSVRRSDRINTNQRSHVHGTPVKTVPRRRDVFHWFLPAQESQL